MAFDDEIIRLLANRSAYLDFSHRGNAGAVDWPDPLVRLYGKMPDHRGEYPIEGTVMGFGTLQRGVSNADFTLEIPSITIELIDPDNFWRERAFDPVYLLYRWVQVYLRVGRAVMQPLDPMTLMAFFDERISTGQITSVAFGAAKKVSLECQLTGGKWLGEMIPRRTVSLTDFPRCLPENLGKAVPIVWGIFSNAVDEFGQIDTGSVSGCRPKTLILIQESWANGNSIAFNWPDQYWEANTGPGTGDDPPDPLYPTLTVAEAVWVYVDSPLAGYGVNVLWIHPESIYDGIPDWVVGAATFRQFDSGLPDYYNGHEGGSYRPFDATEMWSTFTYYPSEYVMGYYESFIYCPMFSVWDDYGYAYGFSVNAVDYYYNAATGEWVYADDGDTAYIEIEYAVWDGHGEDDRDAYVEWGKRADLIDTPQVFTVCHKCGTYNYDPDAPDPLYPGYFGVATVASDGYFRLYINGVLKIALENIPLTVQTGWFGDEAGRDKSNYGQTIAFGWYGMVGALTNILVTAGEDEVPPASPCGEDVSSTNLASGALQALLVDTGKKPSNPDYVDSPFTPDASMPTVNGHEAHNVFGGGTIVRAVFFYVAARKETGEIGPISTIVDLDNDYDPAQAAHAASLSWWKEGDATAYVVWMTQDPNFHPVTKPNLGSPRTKVIRAINHSQFPPIDEELEPFDYQVKFTSLQDGAPFGGSASETGYRYLLAGHTLKAVEQVYVLKPMPTIKNDAPKNVLVGDHAAAATSIHVVYDNDNDDIENFQKDNVVIITGDPEPYTIVNSDEGVHGISPPLRRVFTTGTVIAKATDEDTQVLQREGVDYRQEVVEINSNRYHTLVFPLPQQNTETCDQFEVTANVRGTEIESDGSGILIGDGISITQHFFKNWIFNDYRSSIGDFKPNGNKWFEDVPYQPGLINNASFYAANLVSSGRIGGNYQGAGALTEQITAQELIYQLLTSFDLDLYFDSSTGVGAWSVAMFNPSDIVRASVPEITPDDIVRDSFSLDLGQTTPHANVLPYFAGPITGRVLGQTSDSSNGFLIGNEIKDPTSISTYGQMVAEPLELKWTRHAPTAYNVAMHRLQMLKTPAVHASMTVPIGSVNHSLATVVAVTHPDGFGANGWVKRLCRVMRSDIDLDRMVLHLVLRDIDDLVGP